MYGVGSALKVLGVGMLFENITGVRLLNVRFAGDDFGVHFGRQLLSNACLLTSSLKEALLVGRPHLE